MRIEQLGVGTPEIAVVAAIHGDEPCGVRAVERLLAESPAVERPVKFVVANEAALEQGVRYVEEDLNRAFPGDPDADTHEGRLAHEVAREVRDCTTLALHSTQSYGEPFAVTNTVGAIARTVCPHLPISELVDTQAETDGRLIEYPHTVEVECGYQGSTRAAENAVELVRGFLRATGALPIEGTPELDGDVSSDTDDAAEEDAAGSNDTDGPDDTAESGDTTGADDEGAESSEVTVYRLGRPIPKEPADKYEVFADNFERVEAGEAFAAADGREVVANEPFYPILLSAYGYESVFGYRSERVGVLDG
jgi:hypothetical protein